MLFALIQSHNRFHNWVLIGTNRRAARVFGVVSHRVPVMCVASSQLGISTSPGLCLHKVGERSVLVADCAPKRGNHARGYRVIETKGIANGDDGFAGHDIARIPKLYGRQL